MDIATRTINTLRLLSADMVQKANSGHPGAPMGMAPMAYALWLHALKHDPMAPDWRDRDRFVLSNGHASALLYALLHISGYGLPMTELERFRQWGSQTPGHPERGHTAGIETTTGPLGQGFANAVGLAIAETMMAAHFNRPGHTIVDHRTYVFAGDGCMMEGISSEAASLAGTLQLGKLTVLYDDNGISIEGSTDLAFREDVGLRFEAYGWQVIRVADGNDHLQVLDALRQIGDAQRPTLIICPTLIGYGSPAKQGKASAHGEPLGKENLDQTKAALGMPETAFLVDDAVYQHAWQCLEEGRAAHAQWQEAFKAYAQAHPSLAEEWEQWHRDLLPDDLPSLRELGQTDRDEATRVSSAEILNLLAGSIPNLVGGSADLAPSNKTLIKDAGDYSPGNRAGRNLHFGVREHAMAAIANGMALHGGLRVFCATFFVFSDYMKGAMRLSAIMKLPVIYILTHDSIGVGEDGGTHQPIEQLAALRATPGLQVIRPCDRRETAAAWRVALTSGLPTCLVLTRQNLRQQANSDERALKGGYVLSAEKGGKPGLILMGSGSEVDLLMGAQEALLGEGIPSRVVSIPSMELFLRQEPVYQEAVLPCAARLRLAVEAGASMPWYRLVGLDGAVLALDHFGASAPAEDLFQRYGYTVKHVVSLAKDLLKG
ncbi:MAG: transketolase [Christensenellales bacterium]